MLWCRRVLVGCGLVLAACAEPFQPDRPKNHYVAPTASSSGDGSFRRPWELAAALAGGNGTIGPGDTVWLRGGTYAGEFVSTLRGARGRAVVFRQYPGERATIDGGLRVEEPDVAFWGFEIMQSAPLENDRLPALEIHGARSRFINLVVHDAGQQGITFWDDAVDAEVYGCVVYNNGTHENLDHGIYVHNHTGTKLVESNVLFQNLAYGVHAFAESGNPVQRNVHLLENVAFNNGTISTRYGAKGNILVGGEVPAAGMRVVGNLLYFAVDTAGVNLTVGLDSVDNQEIIVQGNYLWGGATAMLVGPWQRATVEGNALAGTGDMVDLWAMVRAGPWRANVYYRNPVDSAWQFRGVGYPLSAWQAATGLGTGDRATESPPAKAEVFVRPNRYEPGRAFIVVRNWPRALAVDIDLSGVLKGGVYEIRNVQDIFGPPVVQGVYGGAGSVTLPMTGVTPPAAIGRSTPAPERTAPDFDVFLLTTPER